MSLLGLIGRGFGGTIGGGSISAPVLTVADQEDGTGATATITESDEAGTNTVRISLVTGTSRAQNWTDGGERTGNGTVDLELETGTYLAVVVSQLGDAMEISEIIEFTVTDAGDSEFTFDKLRKHVLVNRTLNTDFFAEVITYKRNLCPNKQVTAHCKHTVRHEPNMQGQEVAIETLTVTINKDDFETEPRRGDRVLRSGESTPFIFAYHGKSEEHFWRVNYERRTVLQQGPAK